MKKNNKTELLRTIKYLLCAASAGVIQILSFTLMNEVFKWSYWLAYFIALVLSVVWNFTFNRKYTFRSVANIPIAMLEVLGYYAVFTPASIFWGDALTKIHWNEYLVLAFTMVINLVTEYLFYTFVVYRKSIDSAVKKDDKTKENQSEILAENNNNLNEDNLQKIDEKLDKNN